MAGSESTASIGDDTGTYYIACFQVTPNRLFTAAAMLKTIEANQKQLTESPNGVRSRR